MKSIYLFFLLLISNVVCAQLTVKATVLNSANKLPVSYSLITTGSNKFGIITNEKGEFELMLPDSLANDFLQISCIGYDTTIIRIDQFLKSNKKEIFINHKAFILAVVSISAIEQKFCKREWGSTKNHDNGKFLFSAGCEIATFIPNKSGDTGIISTLRFFIVDEGFPSTPFRAKLYRINPIDKNPGELLNEQDCILTAEKGNSWVKLDISNFKIPIPKEGFFLSMEWLPVSKSHPYTAKLGEREYKGEGQILGCEHTFKPMITWFRYFLGNWTTHFNDDNFDAMIGADVLVECK